MMFFKLPSVPQWAAYIQLMRLDRPIGTLLLLWPTLWALWIAGNGQPDAAIVLIFIAGVCVMRAAGCVINDYADRHIDGLVERTKLRPLTSGQASPKQALVLFAGLIIIAGGLVLMLNSKTVFWSLGAAVIASAYPFMKRYTHWPQLVLGMAFSWGMIMAFTALQNKIPLIAWLLWASNIAWVIAYDTYYAMTDRPDDLKAGIKSTAILFGKHDRNIIAGLQAVHIILLIAVGVLCQLNWPFYTALIAAAATYSYQYWRTSSNDRQHYFSAFLNNNWSGSFVFAGIVLSYLT